jgi:endonuclease YncB( thermonuclease family)
MIPKGQLTVVGTIELRQFWPVSKGTSSSDGDTIHMKVDPQTSFLYASSPKTKPKRIKTFIGAYVVDFGKKKAAITAKNEIKIRLQGIDTPELHYPVIATRDPSKKKAAATEFRQPYGASAASALHDHLNGLIGASGGTLIHATFVTRIDHLRNALDSHGRFVGDILVGTSAGNSINTWLVEQGWAYPLFYDSMTDIEIKTLLAAWKIGKERAARPGKSLKKPLLPFDPTRNIKNAKLPDGGGLNYPKIFRRHATFWTELPGPVPGSQFKQLLQQGLPKKPDKAYLTNYFLSHITALDPKKRVALASKIGAQGQTQFAPDALVFKEDPTTLFAANGTKVKA